MDRVGAANWAKFKAVIRDAHDTFNQDTVIWHRWVDGSVPLYNEQPSGTVQDISLKVLVGFNEFRTWPITRKETSGELQNENMIILINRQYLGELGYLTAKGQFNYRPDKDYFSHRGIRYKPEGGTLVSQAYDDPYLVQIILRQEETLTGNNPLNQ